MIAAALGTVRRALGQALGPPGTDGPRALLVACSGGRDSMTALGLLAILRRSEGLALTLAHVDHGLRSRGEAEAEAALVASVAGELGLPCLSVRLELEPGPGVAARARAARREALQAMGAEAGAAAIVLAHTATDQAETMLMHLTRGAGLEGLAAMRAFERPWLRPLLELTRAETGALVASLELPHVDDPTNDDRSVLRIWLRQEVLPRLRQSNPRLELAMVGLARQAGEAQAALDHWAASVVHERAQPATAHGPGVRFWSLAGFHELPRALRTQALRRMCEQSGVDLVELRRRVIDDMDAAAIAVARSLAGGPGTPRPAPRSWDLHPRRRARIDKNGVLVEPVPAEAEPAGL